MSILSKYTLIYKLTDDKSLLINSLTSALDVVDNETRKKVEDALSGVKDITSEADDELYETLKRRGYLYTTKEEELANIEKMKQINDRLSRMRVNTNFTICPSMGCNLRCTYCFETNSQHINFDLLSDEQLEGIFKYIHGVMKSFKELYDKADEEQKKEIMKIRPSISLFGGEPLLKSNYEIVSRVLEFASNNDVLVHIITNGTTIEFYGSLLEKYSKMLNIQITLDGDKDTHDKRRIRADGSGTFDEICKSVNKILELKIRVNLRINLDKDNLNNLRNLQEVFEENNWLNNELFLPYVSPVQDFCGQSEGVLKEHELLAYLYDNNYYGSEDSFVKAVVAPVIGYLEKFFDPNVKVKPWKMDFCEATSGKNFCFSPDGKISTCLTYVGKGNHTIGTFDQEGLKIDEDAFKLWMQRSIFRMDKCRDCKFALLCGGGCPVAALEQNKNIDCPICSDIEDTLEVYINHIKDQVV